jgi:hypothetical protein
MDDKDTQKIAALWQVWYALLADDDYADATKKRWHEESCDCLDCTIYIVAQVIGTTPNN